MEGEKMYYQSERNTESEMAGPGPMEPDIHELRFHCRELLADCCAIEAERAGDWFILEGRVDSQRTKAALFRLVPEIDGARRIVDRLQVGRSA